MAAARAATAPALNGSFLGGNPNREGRTMFRSEATADSLTSAGTGPLAKSFYSAIGHEAESVKFTERCWLDERQSHAAGDDSQRFELRQHPLHVRGRPVKPSAAGALGELLVGSPYEGRHARHDGLARHANQRVVASRASAERQAAHVEGETRHNLEQLAA